MNVDRVPYSSSGRNIIEKSPKERTNGTEMLKQGHNSVPRRLNTYFYRSNSNFYINTYKLSSIEI